MGTETGGATALTGGRWGAETLLSLGGGTFAEPGVRDRNEIVGDSTGGAPRTLPLP